MFTAIPQRVKIVEVGPRDGLQSEQECLSVATRVELINLLSQSGLRVIEVGSFVSPKWVPQMADSASVYQQLESWANVSYPMLVPNDKGLQQAKSIGVKEIAVFAAASETFSQKNINCSIDESLSRYQSLIKDALQSGMKVRGYVSCVLGCPYEGDIPVETVVRVAYTLYQAGCYEISLGDTIGVGTPFKTAQLLRAVATVIPIGNLAVHFHDTYGQALANCLIALQHGVSTFDASVAGLGGCPYAKGASGNLATEDLLYMLRGMQIETGVDFQKLMAASAFICNAVHHAPRSKASLALHENSCEEPLWRPSFKRISEANLEKFKHFVALHYAVQVGEYAQLYRWSVQNPESFWNSVAQFCGISFIEKPSSVLVNGHKMPGAKWFVDSTLNAAQYLLRCAVEDNKKIAITACGEDGRRQSITYAELHDLVSIWQQYFQQLGIKAFDRVVAVMPNTIETIVQMLATTSLGAIWSSCSPDFGVAGIVDRFSQIEAKLLICTEGYFFKGKWFSLQETCHQLRQALPTLNDIVTIPYFAPQSSPYVPETNFKPKPLTFVAMPFDHPLYIMYSSGTTGKPKCIVHGAGGTLLQHQKELVLHSDLKPEDTMLFYTTCGWMMWNWMVSGLGIGSTLVLYEGAPLYPTSNRLWQVIDEEKVTHFGTSAKYLSAVQKSGLIPKSQFKLSALKTILTTGSPLLPESFDFIYHSVKSDICLSSISGGTDIISCFALGNPQLPVYRGQLQCRGLGMAVEFYNDEGSVVKQQKGELVCIKPFPSMPIGFWGDGEDHAKYRTAYFERYSNIWCHGDYGELTAQDGVVIYGRSDAVLNPGGVRIGTAEIYRQLEPMAEIMDAVAIGQDWEGDQRILLFVVLRNGLNLDEKLIARINETIRLGASPRHVPSLIFQVPDIPRTVNGKISEIAVRHVIHGLPVKNKDALANPESLAYFELSTK